MWRKVGEGKCAHPGVVEGVAMGGRWDGNRGDIVVTKTASAIELSMLLPSVKAIICTEGGVLSHIAVLAREYGIPCVVGARIEENIVGRRVRVENGSIYVEDEG